MELSRQQNFANRISLLSIKAFLNHNTCPPPPPADIQISARNVKVRRKWENAENSRREKHTFCCVLPPVTQFRSELEAKRISLHESKFALLCESDSVKGKQRKGKTSSSSLQVLLLKQEMGFFARNVNVSQGRRERKL